MNNLTLTARMAGHTMVYFGGSRWRRATGPIPRQAARIIVGR
ncbi:MAG: hypothetical protein WC299_14160 [Kiritimatiellia bacterium]